MKPVSRVAIKIGPGASSAIGVVMGLIAQAAFFPGLLPGFPSLDVIGAFMLSLAILGYRKHALFLALFGGLMLDALTGQFIGLTALSYFIVVLIVISIQKNLVKEALTTPAVVMLAAFMLKELVFLFVLVSNGLVFMPARAFSQLEVSSIINACLGTGTYWALHMKLGLEVHVDREF